MVDNFVEDQWEFYKKKVISPKASDVQVSTMKEAFYAGATMSTFAILTLSEMNVKDDDAVQFLEDMRQELTNFAVLTGYDIKERMPV